MRSLSLFLLTPMAGCTSVEPITLGHSPAAPCTPAMLDQYRGELATSEVGADLLRYNLKTKLRWVQPGMAVTMDYREDRLTVYLDSANKVERVSCS